MLCSLFLENQSWYLNTSGKFLKLMLIINIKKKSGKCKELSFVNRYAFSRCAGRPETQSVMVYMICSFSHICNEASNKQN